MNKKLWTSLDDFYSTPSATEADGTYDEFDAEVQVQISAIRTECGIDEDGNVAQHAGQGLERSDDQINDLRALLPSVSRRGFMRLTGAAAVFGLAGCWHSSPETLVPYVQQPEGSTIGEARHYSTFVRTGQHVQAVVAKLYDGRPIKLEGNPDCSTTRGRLDARGQAALVDLYDPDRVSFTRGTGVAEGTRSYQDGPRKNSEASSWAELDGLVGEAINIGSTALLTGPWNGPSRMALLKDVATSFGKPFTHAAWHPFAADVARQAREVSFGVAATPRYDLSEASVLVTLGSDILGGGQAGLAESVGFGDMRKIVGTGEHTSMGQFFAFEPTMSQGGSCADVRARIAMDKLASLTWALAAKVAQGLGVSLPAGVPTFDAGSFDADNIRMLEQLGYGSADGLLAAIADALLAAKKAGKNSLLYVGGVSQSGPESLPLHVAANYINSILGNEGVTVYAEAINEVDTSFAQTKALLASKPDTLIIAGCNPGYDYPDQAGLQAAIKQASTVIYVGDRVNETASLAASLAQTHYFAPTSHDLESWGDAEVRAGAYYLQQPMITPLWDTRALEESLMAFAVAAGQPAASLGQKVQKKAVVERSKVSRKALWHAGLAGVQSWAAYVKTIWTTQMHSQLKAAGKTTAFWKGAIARGVAGSVQAPQPVVAFKASAIPIAAVVSGPSLVISASRILGDGSQANNPFTQEIPDPISRITWDNYISVSMADAQTLKLGKDSVVEVQIAGQSFLVPAMVQPGQQAGVYELFTGWGRTEAGAVADMGGVVPEGGSLSRNHQVNAFQLTTDGARWGLPVTVSKADLSYELACAQGHNYMDGRSIALDDALDAHKEDPSYHNRGHHHALWVDGKGTTDSSVNGSVDSNNLSMWDQTHVNTGRRWGMSIDLNSCTGCNACIVACSIENNVPVVGRDEVRLGREMHWMRIDRYYSTPITEADHTEQHVEHESAIVAGDSKRYYAGAQDSFVEVFHQPMLCQQCGHAPCEEVCPAMATMQNDEGVNVQVYNRCIGTRYCANNCPYKVRRFNYYEYSKYRFGPQGSADPLGRVVKNLRTDLATSAEHEMSEAPLEMMLNPTVVVRSKGVMEKCNFCIGRTRDFRYEEKRTNRKLEDSKQQTACSQTCPTAAITFGDINDPSSTVSKVIDDDRGYRVLDFELNTRPSITYLRKVRNRPVLADEQPNAHGVGHGGHDTHAHAGEGHA